MFLPEWPDLRSVVLAGGVYAHVSDSDIAEFHDHVINMPELTEMERARSWLKRQERSSAVPDEVNEAVERVHKADEAMYAISMAWYRALLVKRKEETKQRLGEIQ
jgi:hypothetical protein